MPTSAHPKNPKFQKDMAVEILGIATALPDHRISQETAVGHARKVYPFFDRFNDLFTNTGIEARYACESADWCRQEHGFEERSSTFQKHASRLISEAAIRAIQAANLKPQDIGIIVVNTITGLTVPSLDVLLLNDIGLPETVERLPIFGFGCGGGVGGLSRTAQLAAARPGVPALFLTVELCSLCARPNDHSVAAFVSSALFGDGAAAVVMRGAEADRHADGSRPTIRAVGERCWPGTKDLLGYDIRNDGFGMVLSAKLPETLRDKLAPAVERFLDANGMALVDIDSFLVHPGGRKILEIAQKVFRLPPDRLAHSWSVLRDYGNMSSAAILFVLKRAIGAGDRGRHLLIAFGPGLSAYFATIDL
jgi:alkylresorcinol/alkylpyrone synthase